MSFWSSPRHGRTQVIVLVLFLFILGGAALWLGSRTSNRPDVAAGRAIAEEFLQQLQQGQSADAWKSTTAEFKSAQGQEAFVRGIKPVKFLRQPLEFASVQTVEVANEPRSEYLFRAATGETVRIVLAREDGRWKVDRWMRQ